MCDRSQENLKAQQDTLALTQARFDACLTSELDVTQAAAQLATTQAQIPPLETSLKQGSHRLGVLLGQAPGWGCCDRAGAWCRRRVALVDPAFQLAVPHHMPALDPSEGTRGGVAPVALPP
jgi:Outer membrane efflux protein